MAQFAYDYNPAKKEDFRQTGISAERFNDWSQSHLYRTSYGNHWTNRPQEPKNVVYAGYGGFIPGLVSENKYGNTYSAIARDCFANPKLGQNVNRLATTGFNSRKIDFADFSLTASSHKYGGSSIQRNHPALHPEKWQTSTQFGFQHPKNLPNPTYRETDKFLETQKQNTRNSGFTQNHTQFDGKGWVPESVLNGDQVRTEYRIRYNPGAPYHRDPTKFRVRRLQKKEQNYNHV